MTNHQLAALLLEEPERPIMIAMFRENGTDDGYLEKVGITIDQVKKGSPFDSSDEDEIEDIEKFNDINAATLIWFE